VAAVLVVAERRRRLVGSSLTNWTRSRRWWTVLVKYTVHEVGEFEGQEASEVFSLLGWRYYVIIFCDYGCSGLPPIFLITSRAVFIMQNFVQVSLNYSERHSVSPRAFCPLIFGLHFVRGVMSRGIFAANILCDNMSKDILSVCHPSSGAILPISCNIARKSTGWRKKTGQIANILKIPWPNCVEIGELLQYYMLNTVVNFFFKNFIAT